MLRRRTVLTAVAALVAAPVLARAEGVRRFASANFAAANEKGGPVLVHIDATWCPTCRAQKPVLEALLADPKYAAVTAFSVDYDSEKPVMRALSAPDRSTIVAFAKGREVARSTGETDRAKIAALIDRALLA